MLQFCIDIGKIGKMGKAELTGFILFSKYNSVMNYNLYYVKLFSLIVYSKSMIIKTNYYLLCHSLGFG